MSKNYNNIALGTLKDMFQARGYTISKAEKINYKASMQNVLFGKNTGNNNSDVIVTFILQEKKICIKHLRQIKEDGVDMDTLYIIVSSLPCTDLTRKEIRKLGLTKNIEMFIYKHLTLNITKHCLVPNHKLMTKEEELNLLKTFKIEKNSLPIMKKTDPVAKFYNFPVNSVVRIQRNLNGIQSDYYRRVC